MNEDAVRHPDRYLKQVLEDPDQARSDYLEARVNGHIFETPDLSVSIL